MIIAFTGVLAALSILLVIWPIIRKGTITLGGPSVAGDLEYAINKQKQAYEEIRIAISDYHVGNISNDQYIRILKDRRWDAAIGLMSEERITDSLNELINQIEDDILTIRGTRGTITLTNICPNCDGQMDINWPICFRCR
jgi:hypothetical protein